MEVRGQISDTGKPARQRFDELRAAIARRDALRVRQARENLGELSEQRLEVQRAAREAARNALTVERTHESADEPRAERKDRIEISDQARDAAELAARASDTSDSERARRVAQLRDEHAAGRLATPERIERAATRLLGGDA